ncbi:MAG: hypothetical protein MUF66_12245 [Gammaproteobacteria bacterium]|nr:hypothetical protein [Gammaproteobacteria bacterium]
MAWDSGKKCSSITLSNSDRTATRASAGLYDNARVLGTIGRSSGKRYFEIQITQIPNSYPHVGGISQSGGDYCDWLGSEDNAIILTNQGEVYDLSGYSKTLTAWDSVNDRLQVAVDFGAGKVWFGKNGTWMDSGNPGSGTNASATFTAGATFYPQAITSWSGTAGSQLVLSAATADLTYTPPSGFTAWEAADGLACAASCAATVNAALQAGPRFSASLSAAATQTSYLGVAARMATAVSAAATVSAALAATQPVAGAVSAQAAATASLQAPGYARLPLAQSVAHPSAAATLPLTQRVTAEGTATLPLRQTVTSCATASSGYWTVAVTLGGTDVSARLTGALSITAEEGAARIAEFRLSPASGAIDPTAWVGAAVTIDYALTDGAGAALFTARRFTGRVDVPEYNPIDRTVLFRCTDGLQALLEAADRPTIDALTPGALWTADLFAADADGYQYATDRASTAPCALDLDTAGTWRWTAWAAKGTPDFELGEGDILDQSLAVSLASARDIVNRVELSIGYRWERLYHRELKVGWFCSEDLCDYLDRSFELPTRDMAIRACDGTGWLLSSISFTPLPPSDTYTCGGTDRILINNFYPELIWGFDAKAVRRWTQTITETYALTLYAAGSEARHGTIGAEAEESYQTDYDSESWEGLGADNTTAARLATPSVSSYPDGSTVGNAGLYPPPAGATELDNGDYAVDQAERSRANALIETALAVQRARILAAHRKNYVEASVALTPCIDRHHTVRIATTYLTATGKVHTVEDRLDLDKGEATTTVRLAVSRGGAGHGDAALTAPSPPSAPAPAAPTGGGGFNTDGDTYLGGIVGAPAYDEDWAGFTGNYAIPEPGAELYPRRLTIDFPEVDTTLRDEHQGSVSADYSIAIPDDELTLSA